MCLTRSNRSSTARSSWCSPRRTRGSWVTSSCLQKFTFIGVTTGQSAATRLFPAWARELGLADPRLCHGQGGSSAAITVHLIQARAASRITVVNRSARRLVAMRSIHGKLGSSIPVRYVENSDAGVNDRMIAELPPGSLVVNATGMGKDTPGSPITKAAVFPERGYAWELNYRGELEFLRQAQRQQAGRNLHVEDGWRYFIHGWAVVMERVFEIQIGDEGLARMAMRDPRL